MPPRSQRPLGAFRAFLAVSATAIVLSGAPSALAAQTGVAAPDSLAPRYGVSPRGAFLRALALPGWGHASIGSYNRGALYFLAESASFWMFTKSRSRLFEARRRVELREAFLLEGAAADGLDDPLEIAELLDADEALADLRGLEEARRQQREDWAALGIFLMLLSGADAYVSSHLKDFPDPIDLTVQPVGAGRVELRVEITPFR